MNLTAIKNNVIFKFVDAVNSKGEFEKQATAVGIVLNASADDSAKNPRWVNVIAVGPDCTTIKVGQQALLPNLRWTSGVDFDGGKVWRSDETQVVAVRDSAEAEVKPLSDVVLFKAIPRALGSSGLIVTLGTTTDTPSGKVVAIGPKAEPDLQGATIYYDDTNFTDVFEYKGHQVSFIRDTAVLAYQ